MENSSTSCKASARIVRFDAGCETEAAVGRMDWVIAKWDSSWEETVVGHPFSVVDVSRKP